MTSYGQLVLAGSSTKGWSPEGIWGDHEGRRPPRGRRRGPRWLPGPARPRLLLGRAGWPQCFLGCPSWLCAHVPSCVPTTVHHRKTIFLPSARGSGRLCGGIFPVICPPRAESLDT